MALLNFKEILELIDKVADKGLSAVEIESAGVKVRIEGKSNEPTFTTFVHQGSGMSSGQHALDRSTTQALPPMPPPSSPVVQAKPAEPEEDLHVIPSPIVGTFYRAPNPESSPFVNVGDRVTKGKVLCIIEAMKLLNEIESDVEGTIVEIVPQNGQPVEYGEKLFAIRTS